MKKCKFSCVHCMLDKLFKMDNSGNDGKCSCEKPEVAKNDFYEASSSKDKRSKINLFGLCRDKSVALTSKRNKKIITSSASSSSKSIVKKSPKWGIKFNCIKKETKTAFNPANQNCCRCTCYKHTSEIEAVSGQTTSDFADDHELISDQASTSKSNSNTNEMDVVEHSSNHLEESGNARSVYSVVPTSFQTNNVPSLIVTAPFSNMHWMRQHEDTEEAARIARAREIEQGVEAPANFVTVRRVQLLCSDLESDCGQPQGPPRRLQLVCPPDLSVESLRALFQMHVTLKSCPVDNITGCHTQVDFIHCLVPDLLTITNCSFYWGKMDRYEAERLLDGKPEGTFLLRDSAHEEFLFSVSFRRYGRSLHARIEQWNHKFSFDSHDPGVYTSNTVCGLIEHYKDPSSCMFFEPILTLPLHRKFTFSLQHLARAVIVSRLTYDNINHLQLPKTLKTYLKEYHYRQKVRVERFDDDVQWLELGNTPT